MEQLSPRRITRVVSDEAVHQAVNEDPVVWVQGWATQVLVGQLFHKLIEGHLEFIIAFIEIYILK